MACAPHKSCLRNECPLVFRRFDGDVGTRNAAGGGCFGIIWIDLCMQAEDSVTITACKAFVSNLIPLRTRLVKDFVSPSAAHHPFRRHDLFIETSEAPSSLCCNVSGNIFSLFQHDLLSVGKVARLIKHKNVQVAHISHHQLIDPSLQSSPRVSLCSSYCYYRSFLPPPAVPLCIQAFRFHFTE